jgi:hypothetical protein
MSSPPDLRQDAFISYTHANNLPVDDKGRGWVDHFHQHLDVQLMQYAGRKVAIWRDPELAGNSVLPESLKKKLQQSEALVIILSPGYLNSDWCMSELKEFCTVAEQTGGLHLNGTSRIFAVVKLPLADDKYPEQIAKQLRYNFFEPTGDSGPPDEFRTDMQNRDERYWLKLKKLAWDLNTLLTAKTQFKETAVERKNPLAPSKGTIYLAETTADLSEYRRKIKEELILNNYNVVPDGALPYVFDTYCEQVHRNLSQAIASINLVGRTYGIIPEGSDNRSILRLQLDLANESASKRAGFKRLIWIPEKWEASDEKMREMLQELRLLTDRRSGFEFLQTSFEEFKTLMHNRLTVSLNGHQAKSSSKEPRNHRLKVYLICDERDVPDAKPLITYLQKEKRYEVFLPEFEEIEGDIPLSVLHQQTLLAADGVIVYWGHGNSRWANAKKDDLEKLPGLEKTEDTGNIRPLRAKTFYLAAPADVRKDIFDPSVAPVIRDQGSFDPALLNDFTRDLEGGSDDEGGNDDVK